MFKKNHASAAPAAWVDASTFPAQQPHEIAAPAASQPAPSQRPEAIQALAAQLQACAEQRRHAARVFHWWDDAEDVVGRDADVSRRIQAVMQRLKASGPCRPLVRPSPSWSGELDQLERMCPHFCPVLRRAIRPHLTLQSMGVAHRLAPILLVGPPGIGKTFFANALAASFGAPPPLFVAIAEETNGSTFAGSSTFWVNSSPGRLFELLAWPRGDHQPVANPILVLDEVDKAADLPYPPLGALYTLLEADTAAMFRDQSLPDLSMDASHVRVIATANDISRLPEPLLSRMNVFHISPPAGEDQRKLILNVFSKAIERLRIEFEPILDRRLLDAATAVSAREARLRFEAAIALALVDGRKFLRLEDWDAVAPERPARRPSAMGFLST